MNAVEEFRRHARECLQMARATPDKDSKVTWSKLAERWARCAELAESQAGPPKRRTPKYRTTPEASAANP
jgi:hypothetical protein